MEKWTEILLPILLTLLSAGSAFLIQFIRLQTLKIKKQIEQLEDDNEKLFANKVLSTAEECIELAVVKTNQVLVDNLKQASADGKLTNEEINRAFVTTYNSALDLMGEEIREQVQKLVPNFDNWIRAKIEYYVKMNKE